LIFERAFGDTTCADESVRRGNRNSLFAIFRRKGSFVNKGPRNAPAGYFYSMRRSVQDSLGSRNRRFISRPGRKNVESTQGSDPHGPTFSTVVGQNARTTLSPGNPHTTTHAMRYIWHGELRKRLLYPVQSTLNTELPPPAASSARRRMAPTIHTLGRDPISADWSMEEQPEYRGRMRHLSAPSPYSKRL
jgi:hypothetical protein